MSEPKQHLQLSVFDRLMSDLYSGAIGEAADDVQVVRRAVLRDVENLLNTRRCIIEPPESYRYVKNSLYTYGIEDFVAKNPKSPQVRQALRRTIQETVTRFEPRLQDVSVDFKPEDGNSQTLCFSVRATLHAEPVREPIYFDTWFSASRGEYKISNVK